jgi:transcriptional regulator of acetoin/glycerol metabolism
LTSRASAIRIPPWPPPLAAEFHARATALADELVALMKRSALEAVRAAQSERQPGRAPGSPRRRRAALARVNGSGAAAPGPTSSSRIPLSLEAYERSAILRALAEGGGGVPAAAKLMGEGKSTLYRRMQFLGIPKGTSKPGSYLVIDGPPTMDSYERAALERAMAEAGGSRLRAAKLLGVGKSTMYRRLERYGIDSRR